MSVYPHSGLFFRPTRTIVISGPHIQVIDSQSHEIVATTADLSGDDLQALLKTGPIRCADVDSRNEHVVTTADDKVLRVYTVDGLQLLSAREAPKKPTSVHFTQDGQTIVVSDKFGDVFSYPLHPGAPSSDAPASLKSELSSHENPSGGKLILGHTSLLTTFLLTPNEKYIITADRDEHIRVSWYPQGYNIEMYCLGHQKFVSAIHIPRFDTSTLLSGGGDPNLKVWDWMSGKLRYEIPVLDAVKPYIKVLPAKGKGAWEDDGQGSAEVPKVHGRKGRAKAKKARAEAEQNSASPAAPATPEATDEAMIATEEASTVRETEAGPVLAINKIESFTGSDGGQHVLFSSVGSTALFARPYTLSSLTAKVQSIDFQKPVLDFVLAESGLVWVLLDGEWNPLGSSIDFPIAEPTMVCVVRWEKDKFIHLSPNDPTVSGLVSRLNSNCLISASAEQLKRLDLYTALSSLPKIHDAEQDALEDLADAADAGSGSGTSTPSGAIGQGKAKALSGKEMARIKNRKAVEDRIRAQGGATGSAGSSAAGAEAANASDEEAGREIKRTRSGDERPAVADDVAMHES